MHYTKYLLAIIFCTSAYAKGKLPELITKQALDNIRFISHDGRFTFFQKSSGALNYSTNYKTEDVLKKDPGTFYLVQSSQRKRLLISAYSNFHRNYDIEKNAEIYIAPYGGTSLQLVATGTSPKLHLGDDWLTYFDPKKELLHLMSLRPDKKTYTVKLSSKPNSFFVPEVVMMNPETLLISESTEKGVAAIVKYNLLSNKSEVIYKSNKSGTKIEMCLFENILVTGEFGIDDVDRGSTISTLKYESTPNLSGMKVLYQANDNDLGNMICDSDGVYFIKTMSSDKKLNINKTEAVLLDYKNGTVTIQSDLEQATQLINMDGRILIPFREKFYVVKGHFQLGIDELKKSSIKTMGESE
jgi:hypothetical protein